jgi:hypothetical protein
MSQLTRRAALYGVAGGVAALAGCTEAGVPADGSGTDGGGTDGDGNGTDGSDGADGDGTDGTDGDGGDGADSDDEEVTTVVRQVGAALSGPAWDRTERRGLCALIAEEGDASWLLDDAPEAVRAFVEETDFAASVLVYVESVGPDTCHDEITFDSTGMGVEDGTFVADATVRGPGSDDVACGDAITYSAALIRVTSDPLPDAARLSVTDGWGETGTVRDGEGVPDSDRLAGGI